MWLLLYGSTLLMGRAWANQSSSFCIQEKFVITRSSDFPSNPTHSFSTCALYYHNSCTPNCEAEFWFISDHINTEQTDGPHHKSCSILRKQAAGRESSARTPWGGTGWHVWSIGTKQSSCYLDSCEHNKKGEYAGGMQTNWLCSSLVAQIKMYRAAQQRSRVCVWKGTVKW